MQNCCQKLAAALLGAGFANPPAPVPISPPIERLAPLGLGRAARVCLALNQIGG